MEGGKTRSEISAQATQQAIVEAAARLFQDRGYQATSMAAIAVEAGVAVQTIYNAIGTKKDVLSRVLDYAAAGEQAPRPVPAFMQERGERAGNAHEFIAQIVEYWRGALVRTAPVFRVIRQGAALDPEVAALDVRRAEQRLRNYGLAAHVLAERGMLRRGLGEDEAAAVIFSIGHPDLYRFLVTDHGWSPEHWAAWVTDALEAALLDPVVR
jgi:AcrR family transcriptional regulator